MGGWAGDLETLLQDVVKNSSDPNNYNNNYDLAITFLCRSNNSSFSIPDLNADADAVNLYHRIDSKEWSDKDFSEIFKDYYEKGTQKRYTLFSPYVGGDYLTMYTNADNQELIENEK